MVAKRSALLALVALLLAGCFNGAPAPKSGPASGRDWPTGWHQVEGRDIQFPPGTPRSISHAGPRQLVLINFWASFCGPCKEEVPLLARLDAGSGVRVLGVSRDLSSEYAADALRTARASYPDVLDTQATYMASLRGLVPVNEIPSSVLVRDGRAIAVHVGPFDGWSDLRSGIAHASTSS